MPIEPPKLSRRRFLQGVGASAAYSALPSTASGKVAKQLLKKAPSINSLTILEEFIKIVDKLDLDFYDICELMGQTSPSTDSPFYTITQSDWDELEEKYDEPNDVIQKSNPYNDGNRNWYINWENGDADRGKPWKYGDPTEDPKRRKVRNDVYAKLLGHKTQLQKLDDWAVSVGKIINKNSSVNNFQELYNTPEGKIIWDNIIWMGNEQADIVTNNDSDDYDYIKGWHSNEEPGSREILKVSVPKKKVKTSTPPETKSNIADIKKTADTVSDIKQAADVVSDIPKVAETASGFAKTLMRGIAFAKHVLKAYKNPAGADQSEPQKPASKAEPASLPHLPSNKLGSNDNDWEEVDDQEAKELERDLARIKDLAGIKVKR